MKGYVEIYQGNPTENNLIFSEGNLIVDSAGEHVVDVFTTLYTPSALGSTAPLSTSSVGIKAITLGCAQSSLGYAPSGLSPAEASVPLIPIIPTPLDTTLQPPVMDSTTSGPGHRGHFLNYINFSGTYNLTGTESLNYGCYHPSGVLNDTSSINSDGFIIESRVARASQIFYDASAGFVVSGVGDVSATREVKYILTLSHDEWQNLDDVYGGLGVIGLWTLDSEKTLNNYTEGSTVSDISLYNVTDIYKNPVFKLFAKKVFLPGGLKLLDSASNDSISIVWSIKF
tara:strand:- start:929 stop:1783 length:855 start_codon:yes stop_codon:yes gene_type:complete